MLWFGLSLIACNISMGWITLYSGLAITLLLRFVSGVPFPEKKYANNPEWKVVCAETNVFALWFPFKNDNKAFEEPLPVTTNQEV